MGIEDDELANGEAGSGSDRTRHPIPRELVAEVHTDLLVANLPQIAEDLDRGVIVSLSPTRFAVRDPPIR